MQLTIEKLVYGGDGLARMPADDRGRREAVFVPFVLEAETIEASVLEQKRSFARGRVEQILKPSPHRIEPACPYFASCGGCHYQHSDYEHQLAIKAAILKENLRRIAKIDLDTELMIHSSPPWNYRNRTRLKVQTIGDFALGYYRLGSHELLPVERCPISSPLINRAIAALWESGRRGEVPQAIEEIELFANADDSKLLLELCCNPGVLKEPAARSAAEKLQNLLPEVAGMVVLDMGRTGSEAKQLAATGTPELVYNTRDASYRVGAGAFFQVNRHLVDELVKTVLDGCGGEAALDLYAGVGLFASSLARRFAQVIAVESSLTAYQDLLYNSPSNVTSVRATTDQFLKHGDLKLRPDLIVVDPPRNGLGETVVRGLVGLKAHRIHYVSCDPATVSRDLSGLFRAGYRIEQAHLVDLFPQTYHLESVFLLAL